MFQSIRAPLRLFAFAALAAAPAIDGMAAPAAGASALRAGRIKAQAVSRYGALPRVFEANHGQFDRSVPFVSRGRGYSLSLMASGALLVLSKPGPGNGAAVPAGRPQDAGGRDRAAAQPARLRMEFSGADPGARIDGYDRLPGQVNYFVGNDPRRWQTHVPTYAKVKYSGIYPGIDLIFYGNQSRLEYDFVVSPEADPSRVRLRFGGADSIALNPGGDLRVAAGGGEMLFGKPSVYQWRKGRRRAVPGDFTLVDGSTVGFRLGRYDHSRPLVIDPVLDYSTYLGGSAYTGDQGNGIAIDSAGNAYITGNTDSTDFPVTPGAYQTKDASYAGGYEQVFVTMMNPAGTALVYSTYIGGTGGDWAEAIALDSQGNAYVTGYTYSKDYPATMGALQTTNPDTNNGSCFVTKLSADGSSLGYSTFLGGNGGTFGDTANAITVDGQGDAYVAGTAASTNFPVTMNAYQSNENAQYGVNAFLTELNAEGSALVYSTYLGGSCTRLPGDHAGAIALDDTGDVYIAGYSCSADFPTSSGAFQTTNTGAANGAGNAFVAKFDPSSGALVYSTLLGGSGIAGLGDSANGLAVDGNGDAFVAGETYSDDFPVTSGAFQTHNLGANLGSSNVFVAKFNPAGSSLVYSTYIGGSGSVAGPGDSANALAIDGYGNAYIAGRSYSPDYPATAGAYQSGRLANAADPIVTVLNSAGDGLLYSTYFGGSFGDYAYGLATDGQGGVYITGKSFSANFPVTSGAFQTRNLAAPGKGSNAFVAKFDLVSQVTPVATTTTVTSSANPATVGAEVTYTATVVAQSGNGQPTGNVTFSVDGTAVETVALNPGGKATLTGSISVAGRYTIAANYQGAAGFEASSGQLAETIQPHATAAPVFSPPQGTYDAAQSIKLTDATKGSTIYYTTNAGSPRSSWTKYGSPIRVAKSETIRAFAEAPDHPESAIVPAKYIIKPPAPTPGFSPAGGAYKLPITVRISDKATAGLVIRYTANGTTPTLASPVFTAAGIKVTKKETIKAIAMATGYSTSAVATAAYSSR